MSRRYNRAPVTQIRKPTFNVVKPFMGVTTIQMNHEMVKELSNFIQGFDTEDLESDLLRLQDTLSNYAEGASIEGEDDIPRTHQNAEWNSGLYFSSSDSDPAFSEDGSCNDDKHYDEREYVFSPEISGVITLILNEKARQLLIEVISECEGQVDRIVWAFRLALEDPTGGPRESRESSYRPYAPQYRRNRR